MQKLSIRWRGEIVLQQLCSCGPYRFIRHPAYLGSIFVLAGIALLCPEAAVIILTSLFFWHRGTLEDSWLSVKYPDFYRSRGGFIPFIGRPKHEPHVCPKA